MSENKCLGYTLSVAGHTIKVNKCGNMAQLREQESRLAALEAENAALHSRLEFTSCQKADVEAQVLELEEQNAALRQDAAVGRAIEKLGDTAFVDLTCSMWDEPQYRWGLKVATKDEPTLTRFYYGDTLYDALEAAGLMEGEVQNE
jgi:hypothetical protein